MTAILSCTADDLYLFNLPFVLHSWEKLGVECMVFVPEEDLYCNDERVSLVLDRSMASFWPFTSPKEKQATYAQCARLYASALQHLFPREILITADADMCVFNFEFWNEIKHSTSITIIGADLVPPAQYPMCYVSMPCARWRQVMQVGDKTYQECLDGLLGDIQAENFRGNYWGKDQETIFKQINSVDKGIQWNISRAAPGTQFATRRADRDGWPFPIPLDIIDAHLPRPGYTKENFDKIYELFVAMYPQDNLQWMLDYWQEYLKLINHV